MLLRLTIGLTKEAEPLVKDVRTNPVENGELFDISYAKILRKAIESVSYVFLELLLIYSNLEGKGRLGKTDRVQIVQGTPKGIHIYNNI